MHAKQKSEGMLQFEREIAELEKRLARGEISNPLEPGEAFVTILRDAVPRMTGSERLYVERLVLHGYREAAELVSGRPIPGNNPSKPN